MKKLFAALLFGFILSFASFSSIGAEEENGIIDLFPYNQEACLRMEPECTNIQVGSSHWSYEYNGYRYHAIRGAARYAVEFEDLDADGYISAAEIGSLSFNAFGALTINDTDEMVVLSTTNARVDLTTVVHRIYAYFNEDGELAMFEDHINAYYIFNEGDAENPDWRLATQTEIDIYLNAEDKPEDTRHTHIRMALDDTHPRGYLLEPLPFLGWHNADVDKAEAPVEDWSIILDEDPDYVVIPAGWVVHSFGTFERGATYPLHSALVASMPHAMIDPEVDPMVLTYDDQPPTFVDIGLLDNDPGTPGANIVIDYEAEFDLPNVVQARWLEMFDGDGKIINQSMYIDFEVDITQDDVVLETITYTYDAGDGTYTPSGPVTAIDTSEFGSGYIATYRATDPLGGVTEVHVPISVGVLPPKFFGVQDRYIDEGTFIDLLKGITAEDGYGEDMTHAIEVFPPAGFNPYSPKPGVYEIDLEFIVNFFIEGTEPTITLVGEGEEDDVVIPFDRDVAYNQEVVISGYHKPAVWTDLETFRDSVSAWGSMFVVIGEDGTLVQRYSRYTWNHTYPGMGEIDFDGTLVEFDSDAAYNQEIDINVYHKPAIWSDLTHFRTTGISWGSLVLVVGDDGTIREIYDRSGHWHTFLAMGEIDFNGTLVEFNSDEALNQPILPNVYHKPAIWTDLTHFRNTSTGWGHFYVLVDGDGNVAETYDCNGHWHTTSEGATQHDQAYLEDWIANVEVEAGGFMIAAFGAAQRGPLEALEIGDPVSFTENALATEQRSDAFLADWQANLELEEGGFVVGAHGGIERPPMNDLEYGDPVSFTLSGPVHMEGDADHFANWQATVELEEGGFLIATHGSNEAPPFRALEFGDPVVLDIGVEEFNYDIVTQTSYTLTVDDTTPPVVMVVNPNYKIYAGQYTSISQAILANVVAFDLHDSQDDLAVYVSNNGGLSLVTPGVYTVEVTAEDLAGNRDTATFTVTVVEPEITQDMIQDMIDAALEDHEPADDDLGCNFGTATPMRTSQIFSGIMAITVPVMLLVGATVFIKSRRG